MTAEELQGPVRLPFNDFRDEYRRYTHSVAPLLHDVEEYLAQIPGKQLRPLILLLSAKACNTLTHSHILLATAIELLHNATLMHDDVVDESDTRRGHESVRHRWSNQVAVLCGDYYLSQVMSILHEVGSADASNLIAHTVATMSQGELKQLSLTTKKEITLDEYIDIIGSKTASLMSLCCELGAMPLPDHKGHDYRKALHDFGYHYGLVFQIRDDVNDTLSPHDIGFPKDFNAESMIEKHRDLAMQALEAIPSSPAKDALGKLLMPSAPSPDNT
jgi:octaprenyl-diphosphate synthase